MAVNDLASLLLAEAGGKTAAERYTDMLNIMSTITNRAAATGRSVDDIIAAPGQYSAWGKPLPPGVERYAQLAQRAIAQVQQHGPVTRAQFYATPTAVGNLPSGLKMEGKTAGHHYFTDTQARPLATVSGYVKPQPVSMELAAALPLQAPRPTTPNEFVAQLQAPQLPDLPAVPARSIETTRISPPVPAPPVPVATRSITPGAGLANLTPNGLPEREPVTQSAFIGNRQVFPGIGLGNLAPFNQRAALAAGVEPDQFAFQPGKRSNFPSSGIGQKVANVADAVLPGVKTVLYSGQERPGQKPVNAKDRHPRGYAGDFYFEANGKPIDAPEFFKDLSLEMVARHNANIGYSAAPKGTSGYYMGPARVHLDTMPLAKDVGRAHGFAGGSAWGASANEWEPELDFARAAGRTLPGWGASRNDAIPTPTPRDVGLSLPALAAPALPEAPVSVPMPAPQIGGTPGPAPVAMPSPPTPAVPGPAGVPMSAPQLGPVAPSLASFSGGASPRLGQEESMAMYGLSLPREAAVPEVPALPFASAREAEDRSMSALRSSGSAIEAMLGDRQAYGRQAPTGLPAASPGAPAPTVPSFPPSMVDAYQQYGRSRATAPSVPGVVSGPGVFAPPMGPPQSMVPHADVVPPSVPTPAPRMSEFDQAKRGGIFAGIPGALLAPTAVQIGRNARSKARGEDIGLFAGVRDAYGRLGGQVRDRFNSRFGGIPTVPSFNVGRGLGAIQGVRSGQYGPGATAYSISNPGASWSVNAYGIPEFESAHGFKGAVPDGF